MNYFVKGNQEVDVTWGIVSRGLKRRYQKAYGRLPSKKELENFRWFMSDPKPSKRDMDRFYKGGPAK